MWRRRMLMNAAGTENAAGGAATGDAAATGQAGQAQQPSMEELLKQIQALQAQNQQLSAQFSTTIDALTNPARGQTNQQDPDEDPVQAEINKVRREADLRVRSVEDQLDQQRFSGLAGRIKANKATLDRAQAIFQHWVQQGTTLIDEATGERRRPTRTDSLIHAIGQEHLQQLAAGPTAEQLAQQAEQQRQQMNTHGVERPGSSFVQVPDSIPTGEAWNNLTPEERLKHWSSILDAKGSW